MKPQRRNGVLVISMLIAAAIILPPYVINKEKIELNDAARAGLPGQFVRLADGVVHYDLSGPADGPLVVLVHGFSAPYFTWDPTVGALNAAGFRVLRYDLYGRGYSDRPDVDYDLDLYVRQIDQLLAVLQVDEAVHVGGLSFGGLVAAAFANQHPEKVRGLVLIDPQAARVSAQSIFPLDIPLVGEYLMNVYIAPVRLAQNQGNDFFRPEGFPDFKAQYLGQMQYRGFKRAMLSTLRSLVGLDPIAQYAQVGKTDLPVLLIWGEEDQTVRADDIQKVRDALPNVEFHAIPQAGHISQYEQPGVVNPLIAAFLNRTTP